MITILTGTPGAGKTAYCVGVIIKDAVEQGRLVFTMGIPDLKLAHVTCPPIAEWTELRQPVEGEAEAHHYFTFPPGSLIVIDESQRVFPNRPSSSKVPPSVAAFETHRHTGVDFVLMTQHPQLLDNHVRKLTGRHIHLRDVGFLGRWFYEWPECADPNQFKSALVKKRYKIPRHAFSLYTSSSKHIKPVRSFPMQLAILGACALGVPALGYVVYQRIQAKTHSESVTSNANGEASREQSGAITMEVPAKMRTELVARMSDRPETAPIYDELRKPTEMPEIVGCIKHEDGCNCYTQQGTKALISYDYCAAWMAGNRPFNPYKVKQQDQPQQTAQPPAQELPHGPQYIGTPGTPLWMERGTPAQPASTPTTTASATAQS